MAFVLISGMEEIKDRTSSCEGTNVTVLEPERIREKLYKITSEIAGRYEGERK